MLQVLDTIQTRATKRYGWIPDRPDHRDFLYEKKAPRSQPAAVDRLTFGIPSYNQLELGSCTGNGCARIFQHRMIKEFGGCPIPSRLFIYYYERAYEGSIKTDSGAQVRDGLKVLGNYGAPPETDWPYNIAKFAVKPPAKAAADALKHVALQYQRVTGGLDGIRAALANGDPVVFGFTVFKSFESAAVARTGIMPMPQKGEGVAGGHCVVFDGYNDKKEMFWCANSWGAAWGLQGWFEMPYDYLRNCSDFWTLQVLK